MEKLIQIHMTDNVAVTLEDIIKGQEVCVGGTWITANDDINIGHKISLCDIPVGANIIKYGSPIGHAVSNIAKGSLIHVHNIKTNLSGTLEYSYNPEKNENKQQTPGTFLGFKRDNEKTGIRNEIWIIPTVGCVNSIAQIIERRAQNLISGSVDGIYAFPHPYGCSQLGEDHENTKKALCGLIRHPNAGGVLVLGLGCENNSIDGMKQMLGEYDPDRVKFLSAQSCEDEVEVALLLLQELVTNAAKAKREVCSMSELIIGLKCGGSDGLSGITANPLVGAFTDRLIAESGSVILTEVPEMFGAETLLMNRCASDNEFHKTVELINEFKEYFIRYNQPVYENPSPGNKAGGISTLEEKSLGCTQKGGNAIVIDVLKYGENVTKKGLNLLCSPGNDLVAATAEAISGAHIVLFTTGRGTPFGSPIPTLKISSNTALFKAKKNWIDFNAGELVNGVDMSQLCDELYTYVRHIASGEKRTKTEQNGLRDFTIFKDGVTL